MTVPTFDPPVAPDIGSGLSPAIRLDQVEYHAGYDETRAASRWVPDRADLSWSNIDETTWEYLYSFFTYALKGGSEAFYWTPFDKVASPTGSPCETSETSGGALGARTYYVAHTWYNVSYGETLPSPEQTQSVQANYYLTVSVPPIPAGAAGWRLYASETSGDLDLQATVTDGSETWTQSGALGSGASPPSSNNLSAQRLWILYEPPTFVRSAPNLWRVSATLLEQFY